MSLHEQITPIEDDERHTFYDTVNLFDADKKLLRKLGSNMVRRANFHIDTNIENLHKSFPDIRNNQLFYEDNLSLRVALDHSAGVLRQDPDEGTLPNDYSRLAIASDFAVESAAANAAFSSPGEHLLREEITDGVAGKSILRMEELLAQYDAALPYEDKGYLRGSLTELLALTLVNYPQNPDRLALPSSLKDDLFHRTDMYIYHMFNGQGHRAKVQVKTSLITLSPKNGFTLNSAALGKPYDKLPDNRHHKDFQLARIFVKEAAGGELDSEEALFMNHALNNFESKLTERIVKAPGTKL